MIPAALSQTIDDTHGASLIQKGEDYPIIQISNSKASASIALHGAHLIDFTPLDQQAVIFTSESAVYRQGKAIRGGIPICWPYFNAHPSEADFPSHGIARNRFWQLLSIDAQADSHTLTFEMPIHEEDLKIIGGPCKLIATFVISDSLSVSLTTTNTGPEDLIIGGALHSYFHIGSIDQATLSGLNEVSYLDTLNDQTSIQHGSLSFSQEFDRVFIPSAHPTTIHDPNLKRKLFVTKENSLATTVWNPWIDKSEGMADLGNDDYQRFLCIEAINWREDLRTIPPGESHSLVQHIHYQLNEA